MVCQKVKIKILRDCICVRQESYAMRQLKYRAKISFQKGNATTNAKSLLSVLAASVKYNDEVEIVCEGEDEKEALEGVVALIQSGLGE